MGIASCVIGGRNCTCICYSTICGLTQFLSDLNPESTDCMRRNTESERVSLGEMKGPRSARTKATNQKEDPVLDCWESWEETVSCMMSQFRINEGQGYKASFTH